MRQKPGIEASRSRFPTRESLANYTLRASFGPLRRLERTQPIDVDGAPLQETGEFARRGAKAPEQKEAERIYGRVAQARRLAENFERRRIEQGKEDALRNAGHHERRPQNPDCAFHLASFACGGPGSRMLAGASVSLIVTPR